MKKHWILKAWCGLILAAFLLTTVAPAPAADDTAAPATKAAKKGKGGKKGGKKGKGKKAQAAGEVTAPEGFVALFNGKDLSGWWGETTTNPTKYLTLSAEDLQKRKEASLPDIQKNWSVENQELVNNGKGLYLTTDKSYRDFELLLDYKTVAKADSGVYLRGCPQVQIWDYTDPAKFSIGSDKGSGGLWNNSKDKPGKDPLVKADKAFGEWNHFRIVMAGEQVWVWLNDQKVVDGAVMENYYERTKPIPAEGPIQLQTHGGEIRWRNVFLREIQPEEAAKWKKGEGK